MGFGQKHVINQEGLKDMENFYGKENMTEGHLRMATMPEDAELIYNKISIAPALNLKMFLSLPASRML